MLKLHLDSGKHKEYYLLCGNDKIGELHYGIYLPEDIKNLLRSAHLNPLHEVVLINKCEIYEKFRKRKLALDILDELNHLEKKTIIWEVDPENKKLVNYLKGIGCYFLAGNEHYMTIHLNSII